MDPKKNLLCASRLFVLRERRFGCSTSGPGPDLLADARTDLEVAALEYAHALGFRHPGDTDACEHDRYVMAFNPDGIDDEALTPFCPVCDKFFRFEETT